MCTITGRERAVRETVDEDCSCGPSLRPRDNKIVFWVSHGFETSISPEDSGVRYWRPETPPCLIGIDQPYERDATINTIWARLMLMITGEISVPETPSPQFIGFKDCLMFIIQPYDLNYVSPRDRFSASLYNQAYTTLMAADYGTCEGLCQGLRISCCEDVEPCRHGTKVYKQLPGNISLWMATLFYRVWIIRMMMAPIHDAQLFHDVLIRGPLYGPALGSRNLHYEILWGLFGPKIPAPLWDTSILWVITHEEKIRAYLGDNDRAKRGERWIATHHQTFAANTVSWLGTNTDLAGCPHNADYWICRLDLDTLRNYQQGRDTWRQVHRGKIACDTCGKRNPHYCDECGETYVYECPGCPLRNCAGCREQRDRSLQAKDMTWSWKWG
ncbi:MAG: hypothetical protein Q9182_006869 [Xanthomendoza sp. 2 TL-2023]